jgi:hypothetical protein
MSGSDLVGDVVAIETHMGLLGVDDGQFGRKRHEGVAAAAGNGVGTLEAAAAGKSSSSADSSRSGNGVIIAKLGDECHVQMVDDMSAISVADGLK